MMRRIAPFILFAFLLLLPAPSAHAQTCTSACPSGYTCTANNTCVQNCSDGSVPGANGCTVDEITVTASSSGNTFATLVTSIVNFFDTNVVPLLYILIFLFFLTGVLRYFFSDNEKNRANGRTFIIWALVAMVVVFSLWGIVNVLLSVIQ